MRLGLDESGECAWVEGVIWARVVERLSQICCVLHCIKWWFEKDLGRPD